MIDGVLIEARKVMANDKGDVLHFMKSDDACFSEFGEVYFSFCVPGAVKGWKKHLKQNQHFVVPVGELKLVLFDDRDGSSTQHEVQEISLGMSSYNLVRIPAEVWYSFSAVSKDQALIANYTDIPHDPAESVTKDLNDQTIPYTWEG